MSQPVAAIGREEQNPYERYAAYLERYNNPMDHGTVNNSSESVAKMKKFRSTPEECETCKNRKYQDGSDENDVSFKTPGHISVASAPSQVMAHEQQHVANAYEKAEKGEGRVLQASVQIKTAVCPECGRTYVSGGETTTRIAYSKGDKNESKAETGSGGDSRHFDRKA